MITGLTESEFFEKESIGTLQQGMYIFKDTRNTAIVNENKDVFLRTADVREQ